MLTCVFIISFILSYLILSYFILSYRILSVINSPTGNQIASPMSLRDEKWSSWSCCVGYPVQGLWTLANGDSKITAVQRCSYAVPCCVKLCYIMTHRTMSHHITERHNLSHHIASWILLRAIVRLMFLSLCSMLTYAIQNTLLRLSRHHYTPINWSPSIALIQSPLALTNIAQHTHSHVLITSLKVLEQHSHC